MMDHDTFEKIEALHKRIEELTGKLAAAEGELKEWRSGDLAKSLQQHMNAEITALHAKTAAQERLTKVNGALMLLLNFMDQLSKTEPTPMTREQNARLNVMLAEITGKIRATLA